MAHQRLEGPEDGPFATARRGGYDTEAVDAYLSSSPTGSRPTRRRPRSPSARSSASASGPARSSAPRRRAPTGSRPRRAPRPSGCARRRSARRARAARPPTPTRRDPRGGRRLRDRDPRGRRRRRDAPSRGRRGGGRARPRGGRRARAADDPRGGRPARAGGAGGRGADRRRSRPRSPTWSPSATRCSPTSRSSAPSSGALIEGPGASDLELPEPRSTAAAFAEEPVAHPEVADAAPVETADEEIEPDAGDPPTVVQPATEDIVLDDDDPGEVVRDGEPTRPYNIELDTDEELYEDERPPDPVPSGRDPGAGAGLASTSRPPTSAGAHRPALSETEHRTTTGLGEATERALAGGPERHHAKTAEQGKLAGPRARRAAARRGLASPRRACSPTGTATGSAPTASSPAWARSAAAASR